MANHLQRGKEWVNVSETWRENAARSSEDSQAGEPTGVSDDLQQTIEEESAEYDAANKEDRLLGGDRASVDDE